MKILSVCPDCEELVRKVMRVDQNGDLYWVCPFCGVVHFTDRWVQRLWSQAELEEVQADPERLGRFMFDTGIEVIGVENLDGNIVVEEFPDTLECLTWFVERQGADE